MGWNRFLVCSGLITLLLAAFIASGVAADNIYYVEKNDSLWSIAQRFAVSISDIQAANGLTGTTIYRKQQLIIPNQPKEQESWTYTVKAGDSLYLLAQRFSTSVATLRSLNSLDSDTLRIGQVLRIPSESNQQPQEPVVYAVKSGDSLFTIAQRFGVTINDLRVLNNLWTDTIYIGQRLLLPAGTRLDSDSAPHVPGVQYSAQELDLLARLVTAESLGEPYEGMVAVAAVVLNRIAHKDYPSTVFDVVYQVVDGRYYQFSPVLDGRIDIPAAASAVKAVQDALAGRDPSKGALGFFNPDKATSNWVRAQPVTVVIGNHVFFTH